MFSKPLKELLSADAEIDDAALISIDSKGIDVRVRQGAQVLFTCWLAPISTVILNFDFGSWRI